MPYIEKRRYYRINDIVGLKYSVNQPHAESDSDIAHELVVTLPHVLARIDREFNRAANILCQENAVLAEALCLLNKKIELLSDAVYPRESFDGTDLHDIPVNISACGIAFLTDVPLECGTCIHLALSLKPSNAVLEFDGKVVACDDALDREDGRMLLRVEFVDANPISQEELIQHIVQRQCLQLAAAKSKG
jgi:c-di-GMP-binding flagellar brake protein YcgR